MNITRAQAIERMAKGEPVETAQWIGIVGQPAEQWAATKWSDFDKPQFAQFRIPPEPRKEAREWWISPSPKGTTNYDYAFSAQHSTATHVREVLPDEVCLRKMTENGVRDFVFDKNVVAARCSTGADKCVAFARAIGLIREEDKS